MSLFNHLPAPDNITHLNSLDENVARYLQFIRCAIGVDNNSLAASFDQHSRPVYSKLTVELMERPWLDIYLSQIAKELIGDCQLKLDILLTHDIDKTSYIENLYLLIRTLVGDVARRKMFYPVRLMHFVTKRGVHRNLKTLKQGRFSNVFLFLPMKNKLNADYEPSEIFGLIQENNIENVGYHYSYDALTQKQLAHEFDYLTSENVIFTRGHYLRSFPEQRKFISRKRLIDLTPYNVIRGGFPLFTSYPLLLGDEQGSRVILSTQVMDTTFEIENVLSDKDALGRFSYILKQAKMYGGVFCINWHNTSQYWGRWPRREFNYKKIIDLLND